MKRLIDGRTKANVSIVLDCSMPRRECALSRPALAAIVNNDHFEIAAGLQPKRLQALAQTDIRIQRRYCNRYETTWQDLILAPFVAGRFPR